MQIVISIGVLLLAYIIGSIPFGWLIVKMKTGKDIRVIESGRTGGTNAMRAAGFWAGLLTAIMDILKGALGGLDGKGLSPRSTPVACTCSDCSYPWSQLLDLSYLNAMSRDVS